MAEKFESLQALTILVNQTKYSLIRNFYVSLFYLVGGSVFLYKLDSHFSLAFVVGEIVLVGLVLLIDGLRTIPIGKSISNTANEIVFLEDTIIVKTVPINILFWINKPSIELKFPIRRFRIEKVLYPVKTIYDLNNKVLVFSKSDKEIYFIPDLFDKGLEEKIRLFNSQ